MPVVHKMPMVQKTASIGEAAMQMVQAGLRACAIS